jgi:hypothetical protein
MGTWIQIGALFEPVEAAVVASALRAGGVRVVEPDYHLHSIFPHRRLAYGGYRLMVFHADVERAKELATGWSKRCPEPVAPCPECGGPGRRKTNWILQAVALYLFGWMLNYRLTRQRRTCPACKHDWQPRRVSSAPFTTDELGYDPEISLFDGIDRLRRLGQLP